MTTAPGRPRWGRVRLTLAALLALAVAAAIAPAVRVALLTAAFLPEFLSDAPARPLTLLTPTPTRERLTYRYTTGSQHYQAGADLLRPAGGSGGMRPAVVFVLGVAPDLADPVFWRVAEGLARLGFVVLVPYPDYITQQYVAPERVIASLTGAFHFLREQEGVAPGRVGLAGFSVGSSLAAVAAADPAVREQAAFLHWFGGYHDAASLTVAIVSGRVPTGAGWMVWQPADLAVTLLRRQLVNTVPHPGERAALARALLEGDAPLSPDQAAALSPEAQAVVRVLTAVTPEQAQQAVAALPADVQASMRALSPSTVAPDIRAPTSVLHEVSDPFVPVVESRRFWDSLPPASRARFTESALFDHLSPRRTLAPQELVREGWAVFRHLYGFFREVLWRTGLTPTPLHAAAWRGGRTRIQELRKGGLLFTPWREAGETRRESSSFPCFVLLPFVRTPPSPHRGVERGRGEARGWRGRVRPGT